MNDSKILELLWARADNAIAALAKKFGARLLRTAKNILNPEDAEECVNDTYLAIWNAIPPKRPDPLTPYVLRTGRNIALNRLRSLSAQKRSAYELSLDELAEYIPAHVQQSPELGQSLNAFLSNLGQANRVIFLRRYWFGDSVKEIAKDMLMTENAVSVRICRIRDGLRHYLNKEGYEI